MEKEEIKRPGIIATLLWAFGIFIIGLTIYSVITWEGSVQNAGLQGSLLIFVSFSSGINAIATGALIDMRTMKLKRQKKRNYINDKTLSGEWTSMRTLRVADSVHQKFTRLLGKVKAQSRKPQIFSDVIEAQVSRSLLLPPKMLRRTDEFMGANKQLSYTM